MMKLSDWNVLKQQKSIKGAAMIEVRFEADFEKMPINCGECDYCVDSDGETAFECKYGYSIADCFRFERNTAKPSWCPLHEVVR